MEEDNKANYPLDDVTIGIISAMDNRAREMQTSFNAAVQTLQGTLNDVLQAFATVHKLNGKWELAPNRRELQEAAPTPQPAPAPVEQQ